MVAVRWVACKKLFEIGLRTLSLGLKIEREKLIQITNANALYTESLSKVQRMFSQSEEYSKTQKISASNNNEDMISISEEGMRFLRNFDVTEAERDIFSEIMHRAVNDGAYNDPKAFINTLSSDEREVLRKTHGLADPIRVDKMSHEGTFNLLLPHENAQDVNNDALLDIGAGKTFRFPPPSAPDSVINAWNEATEGMSPQDKLTMEFKMFVPQLLANMRIDPDTGTAETISNDDPRYRNIFTEPGFDYQNFTQDKIASLEYLFSIGKVSPEQYEMEFKFYNDFLDALKS